MSLIQQVEAALSALPTPSFTAARLDVSDGDLRFTADLSAVDTLGCAFESFVVENQRLQSADAHQLRHVADELAKRLNYLLEPIQPIEVDSEKCVVQMRSVPPTKDDGRTSYYELLVRRPGVLSLCRYAASFGSSRQVILSQVTREVFLRLVRDFAAVA